MPLAVERARAHQEQIDSLWDFDDPVASEARFRAAADTASGLADTASGRADTASGRADTASGRADTASGRADRDVLLTQVGRALGLQGRSEEATDLLGGIRSRNTEVRARLLLERGRVLNSGGSPKRARPRFASAFSLASAAGLEHLAVDALHMLAIVAPPSEQDGLNRRALSLASGASDPRARAWRASLLNNMGWTAFDRGDFPDALALFEDALAARREQGKAGDIQVARWCVARTLRALSRNDEALAIQRDLAEEHRAAGTADPYVDEEIAALTQTSTTPDPGKG